MFESVKVLQSVVDDRIFTIVLINHKSFLHLFHKMCEKHYDLISFCHFCRCINSEAKMVVLCACKVSGSRSEIHGQKMWNISLPRIVLFCK